MGQFQPVKSSCTFRRSEDDHPVFSRQSISAGGISIAIETGRAAGGIAIRAILPSGAKFNTITDARFSGTEDVLWFIEMENDPQFIRGKKSGLTKTDRDELKSLSTTIDSMLGSRPIAHAPVRTQPKRTYDPRTPTLSPEGVHIPTLLSNFLQNEGGDQKDLEDFGRESGLFASLKVRRFGTTGGDPFQIQAETHGQLHNIIDVGYGVSQALPIVVDTLNASSDAALLIQQPEVHLHPMAQAAIGTFFAQQIQRRNAPIIVETHSDYMIDRVRLMIRKEIIHKDDVQVLFFSPTSTDVDIIPITLGDDGSIIDPPKGYREFFLNEQFEFFS